ncbi:hypothetical protein ACOMHN_010679 [Nucella lapillus]
MAQLKLYISSIVSTKAIGANQRKVKDLLDSKKYAHEEIDVTTLGDEEKKAMKAAIKDKTKTDKKVEEMSMPPMPLLFYGDEYLGDIEDFNNAVEDYKLQAFLKLPPGEVPEQENMSGTKAC